MGDLHGYCKILTKHKNYLFCALYLLLETKLEFEVIIYVVLCVSILGIGISIGGIVEYYLVTRDLKNREQIYNHNIDAISKSQSN